MLYIAIILFVLIGLAFIYAKGGKRYLIADLKHPISQLLKRGYDGGFLVVKPVFSKRFVQFSKYIVRLGEFGIEMSFPRAPWSADFYELVEEKCKERDLDYSIEKKDSDNSLEFINVDFKTDTDSAYAVMVEIMTDIFGYPADKKYLALLDNACIEDRLIDSPHQE